MEKNIEREYKKLVSKSEFYNLFSHYEKQEFITQTNVYFDNDRGDLKKKKAAMRIRENHGYCFTLKVWNEDNLEEYEMDVDGNTTLTLLQPEIIALLESLGIQGPFHEIARVVTDRCTIKLERGELCFDINRYNHRIDFEIEYEETKPHDGLSEFLKILNQEQLTYDTNCLSKIQRALLLKD